MRNIFRLFALLAMSAFSFIQCDAKLSEDDDSGGTGADFDANLYYTKAQIDAKFAALETQPVIKAAAVDPIVITDTGYANGADFTVPPGYNGVIFQIITDNPVLYTNELEIHFSADQPSGNGSNWSTKITVPANSSVQVPGITNLYVGTTGVRAWLDPASDYDSFTLKVAPLYWIK